MKKLLLLILLVVLGTVAYSQSILDEMYATDNPNYYKEKAAADTVRNALPLVQQHSTDSIMKFGKFLTQEEANAEYVLMNQSLLKFKKLNNIAYGCMAGSVAMMGISLAIPSTEGSPQTPFYVISGALGLSSAILFVVANNQLKFDRLYITPTGVVYKF